MIGTLLDGILIGPAGKMILWRTFFRIILIIWVLVHVIYYHKPVFEFLKSRRNAKTLFWIEIVMTALVLIALVFFVWEYFSVEFYIDKFYFQTHPIRFI